jgi:phage terminase Nu1 subunit (DNA packaging protein)
MNLSEVVTQRELAALLGISESRVSQLVSDGTIRAGEPVGAQVAAYCENLRAVAAGRAETTEITTERARLLAAQATREEMRLSEDRRELIRVDAVRAELARRYVTARDTLMSLPARLATVLAGEADAAQVDRLLSDEIHRALSEIAAAELAIGAGE